MRTERNQPQKSVFMLLNLIMGSASSQPNTIVTDSPTRRVENEVPMLSTESEFLFFSMP